MIVGRTGTGKTQAGGWHLSRANFTTQPWIVYDFKGDELLGSITRAREIAVTELPTKPGIYIVRPLPDDTEGIGEQMRRIWEQENTGVFVDEGYMVDGPWFRALLTQGRTKRIPMIVLAQRPVWISRFVFSEADFYQVFHLNHSKDRQKIEEYVPVDIDRRLPDFHSYYYDVARNSVCVFKPVPTKDEILAVFDARLAALEEKIGPQRVFV